MAFVAKVTLTSFGVAASGTALDLSAGGTLIVYASGNGSTLNIAIQEYFGLLTSTRWAGNAGTGSFRYGTIGSTGYGALTATVFFGVSSSSAASGNVIDLYFNLYNGVTALFSSSLSMTAGTYTATTVENGVYMYISSSGAFDSVCYATFSFSLLPSGTNPLYLFATDILPAAAGTWRLQMQAIAFSLSSTPPAACFSGDTTVQIENGDFVTICDIASGTILRVYSPDGSFEAVPADVYMFHHGVTHSVALYPYQPSVRVTENHTLLVPCDEAGVLLKPVADRYCKCRREDGYGCEVCDSGVHMEGHAPILARDMNIQPVSEINAAVYHIVLPSAYVQKAVCVGASVFSETYRSGADQLLSDGWTKQ